MEALSGRAVYLGILSSTDQTPTRVNKIATVTTSVETETNTMDQPSTRPLPETTDDQEHAAKVEPSGYRGDNPSSAGPGPTAVKSGTPENSKGAINPSSPADTGTTPGSTHDTP